MQRPTEAKARESKATTEATQSIEKTQPHSEEENDFEILSTESLEEKSTGKMAESKVVKLPGAMKVKAVLQREGEGAEGSSPEIRRFSVSEATFKALVTSVRSVFNIDPQAHCSLFWKDEEEDLVQFSTSEELRHALDSQYDDTLRIFVTVTPGVAGETSGPAAEDEQSGTTRRVTFETPLRGSPFLYPRLNLHHPRPHPWQFRMGAGPFMGPGMGPGMHWGRKGRKMMMKMMRKQKMMAATCNNDEFNTVRQQVPEKFRAWVRQYVRTWFQQGAEAANQIDTLPEGAPPNFRQWLHDFLSHWTQRHAGTASSGSDGEMGMEEEGVEEGVEVAEGMMEGENLPAPEGLPPMYYRWICLFLPRFFRRQNAALGEDQGGAGPQCPAGFGPFHGFGFPWKGRHGCHGKHGKQWKQWKHGKKAWKAWKRGYNSSSSESEDSDCGGKAWKKIPKEFRKYVRVSVKQLHKNKGDNPKAKEKATRAGLSPEVLEFVEQILLEWHAKLSQKRPRDVATEMMEGERSLPSGLEKDHFLWMCRFMARWHRRHAGKCDVMSAWSSGNSSDSSSGEEEQEAWGPWSFGQRGGHRGAGMRGGMRGHMHGMRGGHPFNPFHMHPGMQHGCPPHPGKQHGCPPHPEMSHGCPPHPEMPHGCPPYPEMQHGYPTPPCPPMGGFAPPPAYTPFFDPTQMGGFDMMPPGHMRGFGARRGGACPRGGMGQGFGHRGRNQDGSASGQGTETPYDDMVDRVTEGVKKM